MTPPSPEDCEGQKTTPRGLETHIDTGGEADMNTGGGENTLRHTKRGLEPNKDKKKRMDSGMSARANTDVNVLLFKAHTSKQ